MRLVLLVVCTAASWCCPRCTSMLLLPDLVAGASSQRQPNLSLYKSNNILQLTLQFSSRESCICTLLAWQALLEGTDH